MPEHRNDKGSEDSMEDTWTLFNQILQQDLDLRLRFENGRAKQKHKDAGVYNIAEKDSEGTP